MEIKTYNKGRFRVTEFPSSNFKLLYYDKNKRHIISEVEKTAFNGGFFAYYAEIINGRKVNFTLPVANICADAGDNVPNIAAHYINEWTGGKGLLDGKVKMSCNQNGSKQLHNKKVSTLIVHENNDVEIVSINSLPSKCKYAISGVLTLENGADVDWHRRVRPEGWDGSSMYATYRNFLANKGNTLYLLSGRSTTSNYIYSAEVYNIIKDMGLESCIALDGGGSYIYKENGRIYSATSGSRAVNNIGLIT